MKLLNGLLKWLLVTVSGLSAGLLAIILITTNFELDPFLFRIILLAIIACLAAIAGRLFLRNVWAILQMLIVLISSTLALVLIDRFYESAYQLEFITDRFEIQTPSVRDGGQILFMFVVTLPFLLFFRRKKPKAIKTKTPTARRPGKKIAEGWQTLRYRIKPANWRIWRKLKSKLKKPPSVVKAPRSASQPVSPVHISANRKTTAKIKTSGSRQAVVKSVGKKVKLPANLFKGGANDVKLMGEEEHVCPYCLEEVEKGDPMGVVVCKECGTWHHQDCWNLTGTCGVAHRNEL